MTTNPSGIVKAPAASVPRRSRVSNEDLGARLRLLKPGQAVRALQASNVAYSYAALLRGFTGKPYRAYRADDGGVYITIDA